MTGEFDDPNYCPLDEELGQPATFQFPPQCCRCLAPSPAKTWQIANGKRVDNTNLSVRFTLEVPVCDQCRSELMKTRYAMLAATGSLALLSAIALWFFDPFDSRNAEPKDVFMIWAVTAIFLFPVFIGVYYAIGAIFVPRNMRGVAWLNRDGNKVAFYNREYQRLFENYYPPTETPELSYAEAGADPSRW